MKKHNPEQQRIYFVEFLRIFLILSIFLIHVSVIDIKLRNEMLSLLHTDSWKPTFAVETFFIIGGFFLYRKVVKDARSLSYASCIPPPPMIVHVSNLWMRLMPAVIFSYILLVLAGVRKWWFFPFCFFPAGEGLGLNWALIAGADWFVEVYFVLSIFFISLFRISRKSAWLWICTLAILCWCIQMNNKPEKGFGLGGMYYGVLSLGLVRGFTCMALGMVTSCLSSVWNSKVRPLFRIVATVYEAVALFMLFNYMYRTTHAPYSPIAIEIVVAVLLISAANGWGYLSDFLNRVSGVMWISRYTYSLLLAQATLCAFFAFYHKFNLPHPTCSLVIFGTAIPLTLIEYHFVERWLVPKLKLCFQNAP